MEPTADTQSDIALLELEHRRLKKRLDELSRRLTLTTAEREEYALLKKQKLQTKDRIRRLRDS